MKRFFNFILTMVFFCASFGSINASEVKTNESNMMATVEVETLTVDGCTWTFVFLNGDFIGSAVEC